MAYATLLALMPDRTEKLFTGTLAVINETSLTPYRHSAEIETVAALSRLTKGRHDPAPVLTMPETLAAIHVDSDTVRDFMGDGLVNKCIGIILCDQAVETNGSRFEPPQLVRKPDLAGASAGQVKGKNR